MYSLRTYLLTENIDTMPQTDCTDIMSIQLLENQITKELPDISTLQEQVTYCIHLRNFLHTASVHEKFLKHYNILHKMIQDGDKYFEALVVPKTLTLIILVNSHNYWGYAGTNTETWINVV